MSLYNMVNGFNPACLFLMPMLGRKQDEWPRFRDCFLSDSEDSIVILTRVGGPNRNSGYGEEALYDDPGFIKTWDEAEDDTYGYYEFAVPETWRVDFDKILAGALPEVSDEYVAYLKEFWPMLAKEGYIDKMFHRGADESLNSDAARPCNMEDTK